MTVAGSHGCLASLRTDRVCLATVGPSIGNLDGHGLLHSGRHAGLEWSWSAVACGSLLWGLVGALVQWSKFQSVANSAKRALVNWGAIVTAEWLWYAMLSKQFLQSGYCLGSIALGWRYFMGKGHLWVVVDYDEVPIAIKVHEVSSKVLPWEFRGWGWVEWLLRFLWAMVLAYSTCFNGMFDVLIDAMPNNALAGTVLAFGYSLVAFMDRL